MRRAKVSDLIQSYANGCLFIYNGKHVVLSIAASQANDDVYVQFKIDWKKSGLDATKATIKAPAVKNFQHGKTFELHEKIPVGKGKVWSLNYKIKTT